MSLVDFLVIGAMKCGTTSLHHYLSLHPNIGMAAEKEVNFFFGAHPGSDGNFWRGTDWYQDRFPRGPDIQIRGETSPGYTSPDHPRVAERIAALVPDVRLVYLVRDPLERALSQYRHHRRDGAEHRPADEALLDPGSHYLQRSRFAERLEPFVERFPGAQLAVVEQSDLSERTTGTVTAICEFLGVEPVAPPAVERRRLNRSTTDAPAISEDTAAAFRSSVADDARRLDVLRRELVQIRPVTDPARR